MASTKRELSTTTKNKLIRQLRTEDDSWIHFHAKNSKFLDFVEVLFDDNTNTSTDSDSDWSTTAAQTNCMEFIINAIPSVNNKKLRNLWKLLGNNDESAKLARQHFDKVWRAFDEKYISNPSLIASKPYLALLSGVRFYDDYSFLKICVNRSSTASTIDQYGGCRLKFRIGWSKKQILRTLHSIKTLERLAFMKKIVSQFLGKQTVLFRISINADHFVNDTCVLNHKEWGVKIERAHRHFEVVANGKEFECAEVFCSTNDLMKARQMNGHELYDLVSIVISEFCNASAANEKESIKFYQSALYLSEFWNKDPPSIVKWY